MIWPSNGRPEQLTAADRERFTAEAEAWVSLGRHPHVCGCHYVRLLDGVPCVFAEYVPGGSLAEWIEDGRLYEGGHAAALARILDIAIQVAWGLGHAHTAGRLVHRDVKPGNVLLDPSAGAVTAKVTDFGLAAAHAAAADPGAGRMTPAYASPEQASGVPVGWLLGRRSDVYSFAVSVLEMFTGGVTWMAGPAAGAALRAYLDEGGTDGLPPMPSRLAALLERCFHRNGRLRPASMAEVAGELARVHRSVTGTDHPRPAPATAPLRADELNNRGLSLLDLGREEQAEEAFAAALAADPQHLEAAYNSGLLHWRRGARDDGRHPDDPDGTRRAPVTDADLIARLGAARGPEATRLIEHVERERGGRCAGTRELPWHTERHRIPDPPARLSADGRWALTGDRDGRTHIWDLRRGRRHFTLDDAPPEAVAMAPDGQFAAAAHRDGRLRFWDPADGRCLHAHAVPGWQEGDPSGPVRIGADGRYVTVVRPREVQWWRTGEDEPRRRTPLEPSYRESRWIAVSDDGRWALATPDAGRSAELWGLDPGHRRLTLPGYLNRMTALCLSADGGHALTASRRHLRLWDLGSGRCVSRFATGAGELNALSLSADARYALSGGADGAVRLWDVRQGRCLRTFTEHEDRVVAVLVGAAGDTGISLGHDNTARWWQCPRPRADDAAPPQPSLARRPVERQRADAEARALLDEAEVALDGGRYRDAHGLLARARRLPGYERERRLLDAWWRLARHTGATGLRAAWPLRTFTAEEGGDVRAVALDAAARTVLCLTGEGRLQTWDPASGKRTWQRYGGYHHLAVGMSDDGARLVAGGRGVFVWSPGGDPAQVADVYLEHGDQPAAFSPDCRRAFLVGRNHVLRVYDLDTGRCLRQLGRNESYVAAVALSRDGRLAAVADAGRRVRLWDPESGEPVRVLEEHDGLPDSVSLSAAGDRVLACGRHHGGIALWDATTGARLRVFGDQSPASTAGRLTGDGRFAVTGGADGAVRVWDADSGACLRVLGGHAGAVQALALTPDGRYALSGGGDGTVRLWELDRELDLELDGGLG